MKVKVLLFSAEETGVEKPHKYTFKGYQLPTGEVCVPYESTNDGWYEYADAVEACGTDIVTEWEEIGETSWTAGDVKKSVAGSAGEFGKSAVPDSLHSYLGRGAQ